MYYLYKYIYILYLFGCIIYINILYMYIYINNTLKCYYIQDLCTLVILDMSDVFIDYNYCSTIT